MSVWLLAGGTLLLPSEVWAFVVSGHVETSGGGAVSGAGVAFSDDDGPAAATISGPDGSYSVDLPANTYAVAVTPPEASGLVPQSQPGVVVTANTTLDIVLVDVSPAAYGGVLRDLSGAPVANARLTVSGDGFSYSGSTDASGNFSISASTASARVSVSCEGYYGCSRFGADGYGQWSNLAIDLTGGSVTDASLAWPIYTLNGSVVTSEFVSVAEAPVSYESYAYDPGTGQSFQTSFWGSADAEGLFSLSVSPGQGEVLVTAPEGSGLQNASQEVLVAAADPSPIVVVLAEALEYAGTLVDSNGLPIAAARLSLSGDGFSYQGQTDPTGAFSIQGSSASDRISISCESYYGCTLFGQNGYGQLSNVSVDLSAGSVTGASLVWPVRNLTGVVVDQAQDPVEASEVSWDSYGYDNTTGISTSVSVYQSTTDALGTFSFVVSPGDGELSVTAPQASGLQNASMSVLVDSAPEDPDPVTIVLENAVVYAGTLQDDAGSPIAGARVSVSGDGFSYSGATNASGQFSIAASSQSNRVNLSCESYYGCTNFGPNGNAQLSGLSIDLSSGAVVDALLVWPVHELQCTVTDIDGLPVSGVPANWDSYSYDNATGINYSASNYEATNVDGKVTIRTSIGDGELTITPEQGSGLTPFRVERTVTGDSSLAILVQFAAEATSEVVQAGGAVGTDAEGDGATPQDPIETLIVSAQAGEVTIDEVPVSETPPAGVRFLTQQVSIEAPPSSAGEPIRITFLLDASRIPEGFDFEAIDIYRNGSLVGECAGSSIADPDPCVTERGLVDEGDVRVVVLTSHASEWNFGVTESDPDCESPAECDDSDACTLDACIQGSCVSSPLLGCGTGGSGGTGGTGGTGGSGGTNSTGGTGSTGSTGGTGNTGSTDGCSAASDCDDSDACTADACISNVCLHEPLTSGSCGEGSDPPAGDEPVTPSDPEDNTDNEDGPGIDTSDVEDPQLEAPRMRVPSSSCSLDAVGAGGDAGSRSGISLLLAGAALAITRRRSRR